MQAHLITYYFLETDAQVEAWLQLQPDKPKCKANSDRMRRAWITRRAKHAKTTPSRPKSMPNGAHGCANTCEKAGVSVC